jgi:hypothetical protein
MRARLALLCVCALALAAPSAASAKLIVGISENQPALFSDPIFQNLGVKNARIVVEYDVALNPSGPDYARLSDYMAGAQAAGIEPLVALEHVRGDASGCALKKNYTKAICKLPSAAAYTAAIKALLLAFPTVKTIAPWNEANHFSQPTSRNPKAAAKFTDIVHSLCSSCQLVVADVLDQADDASAKNPTFKNTTKFIKTFRAALKTPRTICGVHNYSDVNRFRSTGTKALIKALGCKEIWLTETGGLYKFGSFWTKKTEKGCKTAPSCQVKATKYMFSLAKHTKTIKRVYVYTWFGGVTPRFDSGLVANGKARPALAVIKQNL